jgi:hypothetical protein
VPIQSDTYTVPRAELAMLAAREYLRLFWWYVLIVPLFGLVLVLFAEGIVRAIGGIALLWPFSIPARSVMASGKAGRLFADGCHMEADEERIVFYGNAERQPRLRFVIKLDQVRALIDRGEYLLVRTMRYGFAPIKVSAFEDPQDVERLKRTVERAVQDRHERIAARL